MLFHKLAEQRGQPIPSAPGLEAMARRANGKGEADVQILRGRVLLALALPLVFVLFSIISHVLKFDEGAVAFVHLAEALTGAVIGAFFGEHSATAILSTR